MSTDISNNPLIRKPSPGIPADMVPVYEKMGCLEFRKRLERGGDYKGRGTDLDKFFRDMLSDPEFVKRLESGEERPS